MKNKQNGGWNIKRNLYKMNKIQYTQTAGKTRETLQEIKQLILVQSI